MDGTSRVVQWLRPRIHCCGPRFNLWLGTEILHATWCNQKRKKIKAWTTEPDGLGCIAGPSHIISSATLGKLFNLYLNFLL